MASWKLDETASCQYSLVALVRLQHLRTLTLSLKHMLCRSLRSSTRRTRPRVEPHRHSLARAQHPGVCLGRLGRGASSSGTVSYLPELPRDAAGRPEGPSQIRQVLQQVPPGPTPPLRPVPTAEAHIRGMFFDLLLIHLKSMAVPA